MSIYFFTPVHYAELQGFKKSLHEFVENYFSLLRGDVVVIQPNRITATVGSYDPTMFETTAKLCSYMTLVVPLIMFSVKYAYRSYSRPIVFQWIQTTKGTMAAEGCERLPDVNLKLKHSINNFLRRIGHKIFWIPHPKFEQEDTLYFPQDKVDFREFYSLREQLEYLGESRFLEVKEGKNSFFRWLNQSDQHPFFDSDQEVFMNCSDFVFSVLYYSDLISKQTLRSCYYQEIKNQLTRISHKISDSPRVCEKCGLSNNHQNTFYGFDLGEFKDFDGIESVHPGDLLIGFEDDTPVHILFLSEKNRENDHWMGCGLWNMGVSVPNPANISLIELQNDYVRWNSKRPLRFKHCSLEKALEKLNS